MKRIYYMVSVILITLLTACQDYNATNFPGYKDAASPTNVVSYSYALESADYTAIGASFTKIFTDSVAKFKTQLTEAKKNKSADSITIQADIDRLTNKLATDSTLLAANDIATNKLFINSLQASKLIASFISTKYLYADANSSAAISFNQSYDTTKIAAANKYSLTMKDYNAMDSISGPGLHDNFSSTLDPNFYIPIYLKRTYAYAVKGDLKLIRYKYYISAAAGTPQLATLYLYDGANWVNYNTANQVSKSFVYRAGKWLDLLVFKEGFTKDIGTFTNVSATGTHKWVWGTYGGTNYMKANAGKGAVTCETWLVSPLIDLNDRKNPTVSFDHAVDFISAGMVVPDLIGTYISTDYTNDITKATWTKLDIIYPPTAITSSWTPFVNSGKVSLKIYVNKKVTIAFKYISLGTAMGWEVANFNVLDE